MPRDDLATDLMRIAHGLATASGSLDSARERLEEREAALNLGSHWSDAELAWVTSQWNTVHRWVASRADLPTPREVELLKRSRTREEREDAFEIAALKALRSEGIEDVWDLEWLVPLIRAARASAPILDDEEY